MLRRETKPEKIKMTAARASSTFARAGDNRLWDALRARRREIALEQGVPPYVEFQDATLTEMVEERPQTIAQLAHITGVGSRQRAASAQDYLEIILAHAYDDDDSAPAIDTAIETLQLFRLGLSVPASAARRGLKENTIYNHLTHAVARGEVELREVVALSDEELSAIRDALRAHDGAALKPVFESLGGRYSYEVLRCVRADNDHIRTLTNS